MLTNILALVWSIILWGLWLDHTWMVHKLTISVNTWHLPIVLHIRLKECDTWHEDAKLSYERTPMCYAKCDTLHNSLQRVVYTNK